MKTTIPATGDLRAKAELVLAQWKELPIAADYYVDSFQVYKNGTMQFTVKPGDNAEGGDGGDT